MLMFCLCVGVNSEMTKREFGDHLVAGVSQLVCNQITDRLGSILLGELQRHILPTIAGSLDSIKTQILIDMDKRLVSNDQLLRETIAKVCSNKVRFKNLLYAQVGFAHILALTLLIHVIRIFGSRPLWRCLVIRLRRAFSLACNMCSRNR